MSRNLIVVNPPHDFIDLLEGGYSGQHFVIFCDVDEEKGKLTYDRVNFPKDLAAFAQCSPRPEVKAFPGPDSSTVHVNDRSVVEEEVLEEMRDRGVEVVIMRKGSGVHAYEPKAHPELEQGEVLFCYVTKESLSLFGPELLRLLRIGSKVLDVGFKPDKGRKKEDYFPVFTLIADLDVATRKRLGCEVPEYA